MNIDVPKSCIGGGNYRAVGSCSICYGEVRVFTGAWFGINPPVATCSKCHATESRRLPVIEMDGPVRSDAFPWRLVC